MRFERSRRCEGGLVYQGTQQESPSVFQAAEDVVDEAEARRARSGAPHRRTAAALEGAEEAVGSFTSRSRRMPFRSAGP